VSWVTVGLARRGVQAGIAKRKTNSPIQQSLSFLRSLNQNGFKLYGVCLWRVVWGRPGGGAMMDAGVPLKAPVAGKSHGLIKKNDGFCCID